MRKFIGRLNAILLDPLFKIAITGKNQRQITGFLERQNLKE